MFKKAFWIMFIFAFTILTAQAKLYIRSLDVETVNMEKKGYLAIIIDDFGYSGEGTEQMLDLPFDFTAALMPFSPNTAEDLALIKEKGKEYIVHMPMESKTGKKEWVGDKGIFENMTDEEIKAVTNEALDIVEGAVGVNNHMGSKITADERSLSAVFDVIKERNLLFIDSVTEADTIAKDLGDKMGIKVFERDVFLDSTDDVETIKKNILKAGRVACDKGYAIAIGHVGPEGGRATARALKESLGELEKMGVELITVSRLKEITDF